MNITLELLNLQKNYKAITVEEEIVMFNNYQLKKDPILLDKIVNQYLLLVSKIVINAYHDIENNEVREDLFQIGCIGLLKAIEKFDSSKGARFSTYLNLYVRSECKDQFKSLSGSVYIPKNSTEEDVVNEIEIGDELNQQADTLKEYNEESYYINCLLQDLTKRERYVLTHYYGLGGITTKKTEEMALELSLSGSTVRNTLKDARDKVLIRVRDKKELLKEIFYK